MTRSLSFLLVALALVAASCGADERADAPDALSMTGPLPVPEGEVVLTITGAGQPNVGDEVSVDLDGIESLGTTTVRVFEPFVNQELEFTGVPASQLLAAAGIGPDEQLVWIALDDYSVRFSRGQLEAEQALLATRLNGAEIDIEDGGPIRIVFPEPDGDLARDTNQWIWSLHLIEAG